MFKDKKVLVIGMARSGIAAARKLKELGAVVTINDSKSFEEIKDDIDGLNVDMQLGGKPRGITNFDMLVMSPGVPTHLDFVLEAKNHDIPVIGELELGYLTQKGHYVGITGTNGKTTTTTLTYNIYKNAGREAYAVGNIGNPITGVRPLETPYFITEVSSFQLETTESFNVHVGAFLNITPDHLNRHKTMDAYLEAKCRLFENQSSDDFVVLNYDDENLRKLSFESQVIYFSKTPLDRGFYVEDGNLYAHINEKTLIMSVEEIPVPGDHNIENVLAAAAVAYLDGIQVETIRETVMAFKGVEHRIEYVGTFSGVKCYNDSKATNPESSIVAVKSMRQPTVLILGGMDKGSEFDELFKVFTRHIEQIVVFGETKEIIKMTADKFNYHAVTLVNDLDEAVSTAFDLSKDNGNILLSPACASWDMYDSYEVRGDHFKQLVKER
jgi:UDP-N-acetylmuramoylalanine--D-glutamate ligase